MSARLLTRAPAAVPGRVKVIYFVDADADFGVLPRLLQPLAKLGVAPVRVHASTENGDGAEMRVDLRIAGVSARTAHLLDKALRGTVGVRSVIALVE